MQVNEMQDAVELVSSGYAKKFGIERDAVWFMLKLQEELGELTQAFINLKGLSRDRGQSADDAISSFADECADVLAHVLLLARHEGVDLEAAVSDKWLRWTQTS
jgi:NTP pyrophosphatase (non-canonical NTP hydrolase)